METVQQELICSRIRISNRMKRSHHGYVWSSVAIQVSILLAVVSLSQTRGDASNSIWKRLRQITRGRKKLSPLKSIVNPTSTTLNVPTTDVSNSYTQQHAENEVSTGRDEGRVMHSQHSNETNLAIAGNDEPISVYSRNSTDVTLLDSFQVVVAEDEDDEENDDDNFRFFPDWRQRNHKNSESKKKFLERISIMLSTLFGRDIDADILPSDKLRQMMRNQFSIGKPNINLTEVEENDSMLDSVTPQSDLSLPGRYIHVVTTAALPWFTGTAVNPLLRAAYLHRRTIEINKQYEQEEKVDGSPKQVPFHHNRRYVTLVIPWLELKEDQIELYNNRVFESPAQQEDYIRDWLRTEAKMEDAADDLEILFYPARYHSGLRSVFAMGDIMDVIPSANRDVCILEEPEHCNWFRAPGHGWTKQFNYVVGVVHTNYKEYALSHYSGLWTAPAIQLISAAMVRAYCHKVIKLSLILQSFAPEKEETSNVHGVRSDFIHTGLVRSEQLMSVRLKEIESTDNLTLGNKTDGTNSTEGENENANDVYFIGKLLWAKGLDIMLELEDYYKQVTGQYFNIDIYGSGPDSKAITRAFHGFRMYQKKTDDKSNNTENNIGLERNSSSFNIAIMGTTFSVETFVDNQNNEENDSLPNLESLQVMAKEQIAKIKETINSVEIPKSFSEFRRQPIPAMFPGRVDHAELRKYKIFVNPSISEVLCTTTAEALAMGKFAIIPDHPSNKFFLQFPNCLAYRNKFEFVANMRWALTHDPEPLTPTLARIFSWEAATDRLIDASAVTYRQALQQERVGTEKIDERIAWLHNELGKGSKGDLLRKLFGAGPVSNQVKYQKQKQSTTDNNEDVKDEVSEVGLRDKFYRSSFAKALRAALEDVSFMMQ